MSVKQCNIPNNSESDSDSDYDTTSKRRKVPHHLQAGPSTTRHLFPNNDGDGDCEHNER